MFVEHEQHVSRQRESVGHFLLEQGTSRLCLQLLDARVQVQPSGRRREDDRRDHADPHNGSGGAGDETPEPRRREPRMRFRSFWEQRRQQHDRQTATEQNAKTDEAPQILKRREVDEQQGEECRSRRHLREHHARSGACHTPGRGVGRLPRATLFEIAEIQEHHAIDAEAEQHACRSARGGGQAALNQPVDAERQHSRQRERCASVQHHPRRSEYREDDEQQQDQRADRIHDPFPPDQLFGLE